MISMCVIGRSSARRSMSVGILICAVTIAASFFFNSVEQNTLSTNLYDKSAVRRIILSTSQSQPSNMQLPAVINIDPFANLRLSSIQPSVRNEKPNTNQENADANQDSSEIKKPHNNQQQPSEDRKLTTNQDQSPDTPSPLREPLSDEALPAKSKLQINNKVNMEVVQNASTNVDGFQNDSCMSIKLMPEGTMPLVSLLSVPGSGNTWTRFLIEHATGIYTGSIYADNSLYKTGFLGELQEVESGTIVVVKAHAVRNYPFGKVIILIRNPFNCFMAEFNRQKGHGNTKLADVSLFETSDWEMFVKNASDRWFHMLERDLKRFKPSDVLVVYYESLLVDLAGSLEKMVRFLGLPVKGSRLECTRKVSDKTKFHRPHRSLGFDPYNMELTNGINSNIEKARRLLFQRYNSSLPKYEKGTFREDLEEV